MVLSLLAALGLVLLSGCSAGVSTRCGYDWLAGPQQHLICETRFHHPGKDSTFVMYTYDRDGTLVPLYGSQSSAGLLATLTGDLLSAAP